MGSSVAMISIDKARITLGDKADNMTDQQVQTVINSLTRLAETVVDRVLSMTPEERKALDEKILKEKNQKASAVGIKVE